MPLQHISGITGFISRTDCILLSPTEPKYTNPHRSKTSHKKPKYRIMIHITKCASCSHPLDLYVMSCDLFSLRKSQTQSKNKDLRPL